MKHERERKRERERERERERKKQQRIFMWRRCIMWTSVRAGRQFNQTSDDIGSALEKRWGVNKATWTGLQRGSSMSRFVLADSLVAVGSSVLLYLMGLTEKNRRKIRGSFRFSLTISSIRRDVTPRALRVSFRFYPLFPPAPFQSLSPLPLFHLSPPSVPLCVSLSLSLFLSPLTLFVFLSPFSTLARVFYLFT